MSNIISHSANISCQTDVIVSLQGTAAHGHGAWTQKSLTFTCISGDVCRMIAVGKCLLHNVKHGVNI